MGKFVPDTVVGRMYRKHLELILKNDIDGLVDLYAPNALLISSLNSARKTNFFRGREELKKHFIQILGVKSLDVEVAFWREQSGPQAMMVAETVKTTAAGDSSVRFADSWVIENGRIKIHLAGMSQ